MTRYQYDLIADAIQYAREIAEYTFDEEAELDTLLDDLASEIQE